MEPCVHEGECLEPGWDTLGDVGWDGRWLDAVAGPKRAGAGARQNRLQASSWELPMYPAWNYRGAGVPG